ncbi:MULTISPECIES: efflux RND transporter permease subunit [Alteromonadaceae]|uniref:Efflux RND transporter permease subunit n=1 Tax=Brumicola blandensis TaxID=3075611 RepID=A0AAW8R2U5_9ALTE|nr:MULTISPECIES: efflux RND transporter permease subunit [unclassified Alteromonas]MDT0582180.1 efflux RND transporter permease subunit [Alteromonas sp. W409]MDT0627864.1 efflux RND transporter permease subunit [Alteromonas sp. W364]
MNDQKPDLGKPTIMDVFCKRPVLSIVLSLALVLVGIRAAIDLPILQFPKIESASLQITTPYVGASAEVVQGFITEPIERAAASVPGVDYVDSRTTPGVSTVTVWLRLGVDSTRALAELSSRLDQIRFELPEGAEDPAVQVVRADRPFAVFYLTVNYDEIEAGMSRIEVTDYLSRRVVPSLSTIPGVQRVGLEGGRSPAMRVWLNAEKMAALDVAADDVSAALRANNLIATVGRTENSSQRVGLLTDTSLSSVEEFENLVIRQVDGAQIRIRDIADVRLGEEEGQVSSRLDKDTVLYISVWPLPGANEIEIGDRLYEMLDKINPTLPQGLSITDGYDGTLYMRSALREIFITLIETVLLVGLVVVAMMGSFRTALVPLVTIPISILGAIAMMTLMGFTLNLLTVLAIVLSVGLVVDDAIVVVENVARYMREGMSRMEAALASSRQLLAPIISMTITLAAVYAPIGLLSGLTGALFKEFAFTLAIAVLISGLVAITLSPIMSAYASPEGGKEGKLTRKVNGIFEALQNRYEKILLATLNYKAQVLTIAVILSLLSIPFYLLSLKELAPTEDQSSINVIVESAPEASLEYSMTQMDQVVDTMKELEGAKFMWQIVNPVGAFSGVDFIDPSEREQSVQEMFWKAFGSLSSVSGLKAFPVLDSALPTSGNFSVELVVLSTDSYTDMKVFANQMVQAANESGKFLFAETDLKIDLPQARFNIDRKRVADLGMDLSTVSRQLSVLLSGNFVNRYNQDGRAYRVIPMIDDAGRANPDAILDLQIRTPAGDLVPVRSIATLVTETAPRVLSKFQQKNAFRIYGEVIPGTTKEQGLSALEDAAAALLPEDYTIDYAGESRQIRLEGNTLEGVLLVALVFVFLVLAVQFNSFRDPLVVLLGSVPLALAGAMMFAFLDFTTINIYSQVGFITLVGLIAKNGILIVEFANTMQKRGYEKIDAIQIAAKTRLRPVLMTTGATVLGHFPLVLVTGAGAEARNSIGIILVAGMLVGTAFTLLVLPSVYMVLASKHSPDELEDPELSNSHS